MGFDKKILDLSRTIYQKSVMVHGSKENPKEHIENIRGMIREFIRTEVVPYELTNQEKMSFILKNELIITRAIINGHKSIDQDEYQKTRDKIKKYRIEILNFINKSLYLYYEIKYPIRHTRKTQTHYR